MFIPRTTWTWQVRTFYFVFLYIFVFQVPRRIPLSRRKYSLLLLYLIREKQGTIRV